MGLSVVDKLNALSGEMESLLDFIAKDEPLGEDFQTYVDENEIKIEKQAHLNIALVEYLLDGKMQDGTRVLDYYTDKGEQKNDFVIEALKQSATGVFEIKKVLKNAYECYSLTSEKDFCLIPLVKMVNLRGISRGDYIRARVIEMENEYYLLEIYDVISSLNFYRAACEALKTIISNSKSAIFKNDEKKEKFEKSVAEFEQVFDARFKNYDKEKIITTNKLADSLLASLSEDCEIEDLIKEPETYKFFDVQEFKSDEDFVQNAIGGFSKHNCTYDVGFYFDKQKGLFVVPFLGTFYKIFEQNEPIEGTKECIREFLKSDKVPYGVIEHAIKKYPNFLEIVNTALDTNFLGSLEILEKFKGKKEAQEGVFSPITVLYNSKVFSDLLGFEEQPQKPQTQAVGRNEPCPCGSGKKFKHCCGANL